MIRKNSPISPNAPIEHTYKGTRKFNMHNNIVVLIFQNFKNREETRRHEIYSVTVCFRNKNNTLNSLSDHRCLLWTSGLIQLVAWKAITNASDESRAAVFKDNEIVCIFYQILLLNQLA
jgi:hypothetical protein